MSLDVDADGFYSPWRVYKVRAGHGYTVEILKREPGQADQRGGVELLDLSWTDAQSLEAALDAILAKDRRMVPPAKLIRTRLKEQKRQLAKLQADTTEMKRHIRESEAELRVWVRRAVREAGKKP